MFVEVVLEQVKLAENLENLSNSKDWYKLENECKMIEELNFQITRKW